MISLLTQFSCFVCTLMNSFYHVPLIAQMSIFAEQGLYIQLSIFFLISMQDEKHQVIFYLNYAIHYRSAD